MSTRDQELNGRLGVESEVQSAGALESQLYALEERLREVAGANVRAEAAVRLEMGRVLVGLERGDQAWAAARPALEALLTAEEWGQAAEVCEVLFLSDQPGALAALGQGIWLAVTYPVDPRITVKMLEHVVEETPQDSDGAAVAAATARYVVGLRAEGKVHSDLAFYTDQLLGRVAERHSDVKEKAQFDLWVERLELDQPDKFLVRLRNVVDVLVQDDWWFDREALQRRLPVN